MKKASRGKPLHRQIFVLTAEEQRIISFVVVALVLGLATKHYRATRASPTVTHAIAHTVTAASNPVEKRVTEKQRAR